MEIFRKRRPLNNNFLIIRHLNFVEKDVKIFLMISFDRRIESIIPFLMHIVFILSIFTCEVFNFIFVSLRLDHKYPHKILNKNIKK